MAGDGPPGSGEMQQLASLGKLLLGSVGTGFTHYYSTRRGSYISLSSKEGLNTSDGFSESGVYHVN